MSFVLQMAPNIFNHIQSGASRPRVADNFRQMKWGYFITKARLMQ